MFQPNYNIRNNNMNFANSDGQLLNMHRMSLGALPQEFHDVPQNIDTNTNRRRMFHPPLMQLTSGVFQTNSRPTRHASTTETSRLQAQNTVYPGPSHQVSYPVNPNTSNVNMNTATDNRRSDNVPLDTREIKGQKGSVPPRTTANNSIVQNNSTRSNATASTSADQNMSNGNVAGKNLNVRVFGSTENEKFFIFTGTVERVIKWNKIFRNHFCFFEVIASVISIQEGSMRTQKIMLLRDKKGPILQVIYYNITTHMDIEDFHVGQVLRCVGKMTASNILNAVSIRTATREETETLQRLCLVCDHAISHFLNA